MIVAVFLAYNVVEFACKTIVFPLFTCFHGEMDITTVFGTVVPGSNPGGSTKGE